ncbi:MAG TPA: Crp/Fnr family transcriptional regulator [Bacteroidales bacterium]|nr:Crp/Fnr family transcriptional regulator [Bacteroidales bacterium]
MTTEKELIELEPCDKNCALCFLNFSDVLVKNSLFEGLDKRTVGSLIKNTHHQLRQLTKGEVYATEGETLNHYIIIVKGSIVGEMVDYEGNMLTVEKRSAPQSLATAFLFGKKNKLPVTITALEETALLIIAKEELLSLFSQSKTITKNFLDTISNRAQFLGDRIKLLSIKDLKGKIAYYLMEQYNRNNQPGFRIPHSQQELADMFGSTRPSVGRVFRDLHRKELIEANGKQITILNKQEIAKLIY